MSDPNRPADEPTDTAAEADQPIDDHPRYRVQAPGADYYLPRRPGHGSRGVLLVDREQQLVYLLDADDERRVFVVRDTRPLIGDPADLAVDPPPGADHVVRAAIESQYDVIAAQWVGSGETVDLNAPAGGARDDDR